MIERRSNRINGDRWLLGKRCPYAGECDIFQNKKERRPELSLTIYRNVFCNRGNKGWVNCEHYHNFETMHTRSET